MNERIVDGCAEMVIFEAATDSREGAAKAGLSAFFEQAWEASDRQMHLRLREGKKVLFFTFYFFYLFLLFLSLIYKSFDWLFLVYIYIYICTVQFASA